MKRTITVTGAGVYYRNVELGVLVDTIKSSFSMSQSGRYAITIVEGGNFDFIHSPLHHAHLYYCVTCRSSKKFLGLICKKEFDKLFFVPDENKRYNITVKKVS